MWMEDEGEEEEREEGGEEEEEEGEREEVRVCVFVGQPIESG